MNAQLGFDDLFLTTHVSHKLEVFDDAATSFRSEHVYVVKAMGRCRFFLRKFRWSGGDTIGDPELDCDYDQWGHPKHRLHGPVIKDGNQFLILVDLGRTLEVGDHELVHIRHNLHSLEGKFEPHLTHAIWSGGVENVNLTVILPASAGRVVTYSESNRETGQVESTDRLAVYESQESGRVCYQKVKELRGTEANIILRLDWNLVGAN